MDKKNVHLEVQIRLAMEKDGKEEQDWRMMHAVEAALIAWLLMLVRRASK